MFGRIYSFLRGAAGRRRRRVHGRGHGARSRGSTARSSTAWTCEHYGRADYEQMLANVADLPAEQRKSLMVSGLNELVFVIQLAVRTRYGAQEEAVVSGIIKDGFRKLGVA